MRSMNGLQFGALLALAGTLATGSRADSLGSGFTYQGSLSQGGTPLNQSADFQLRLWDAAVRGTMVGPTIVIENVSVVDGLFTIEPDFGVLSFNGDARWLGVAVRSPHDPEGIRPFETLAPRQQITATPYALQVRGSFVDDDLNVGIGTTSPKAKLHVDGSAAFRGPDPWVDVRAFGAKGDGITPDSDAIQAAIDAAAGGMVFFPAGVYKITKALDVGSGESGTQLRGLSNTKSILEVHGGVNGIEISNHWVIVSDLYVRCAAENERRGTGIRVTDGKYGLIERCRIGSSIGSMANAFEKGVELVDTAYYTTVTKCHIRGNTYNVYCRVMNREDGPNDSHVIDNAIQAGQYGIYIEDTDEVRVELNAIEQYNVCGVYCGARAPTILDNRFESSGVLPIELGAGVDEAQIAHNFFGYAGKRNVLDNSGRQHNYIDESQIVFGYMGLTGTESNNYGGSITLTESDRRISELKIQATKGNLQLEASKPGTCIELQSDVVGRGAVSGRRLSGGVAALDFAPNVEADTSAGNVFTLTTTGDCTLDVVNGAPGQTVVFIVTDDGVGGHIVSFGAGVKSPGPLTGSANRAATVTFVYDGVYWYEVSRRTGL